MIVGITGLLSRWLKRYFTILMLKAVTGKGPINIFLMARSGLHM